MDRRDAGSNHYTKTHRLASAAGYYGTFAWTYDGTGNRTSETAGAVASAYAYRANSNLLASITPAGGTARSFAYEATGNIVGATRNGALGLSFAYDENGRLSQAFQTNNPLEGATYAYDARWRLASRAITHAAAPGTMIGYIHDIRDHIIAETDASGVTQREYIWLDDLPVAVVDAVATSPVIYYVHTDHLFRPVAMTSASQAIAWSAIYQPFGAVAAINAQNTTMDLRFPGQWFQLETGLHYNWHRHYDPTTGRYLQPDPLIVDDGAATVGGLSTVLTETTSSVSNGALIAGTMGSIAPQAFLPRVAARALLPDGPSVYAYARQTPLVKSDPSGLDNRYGLPKQFWRWYHRCYKKPELASRKYAMNDGHWVVQFNGEDMSKVATLLRNDERFEALRKERDVDIIFDMPIYFKNNKASKRVKISNSIIKYVSILKATLEFSIYLTK